MYIGIDDQNSGADPPPGPDPAGDPMTVAQFDIRLVVDPAGNTQVYVYGPALGSSAASQFNFVTTGLMEYSPPGENGRLSGLQFPAFAGDTTSVYRAEYTLTPGGVSINWITGCANQQTTVTLSSAGGSPPAQCTPDAGPIGYDSGTSGGGSGGDDGGAQVDATIGDDGGATGDDGGATSDDGGATGDDGGATSDDGGATGDDGGTSGDDGGGLADATAGDDGGGGGMEAGAGVIGLSNAPVGRGAARASPQDDAGGGCAVGPRAGSSMLAGAASVLGLFLVVRRRRRGGPAT
jgi:hypothetical protein